jgi:hypothetical protein
MFGLGWQGWTKRPRAAQPKGAHRSEGGPRPIQLPRSSIAKIAQRPKHIKERRQHCQLAPAVDRHLHRPRAEFVQRS